MHKVFDNPLVYKGDQLTVVHANFKQLSSVLYRLSVFEVDGVFGTWFRPLSSMNRKGAFPTASMPNWT